MGKFRIIVIAALALSLVAATTIGGCTPAATSKIKVVTTTSLLATIVERVGGDKVDVVNIIPPAQCPGHFDVKPGDIQKLADADLFLLHGWQGEMFSQELIASAGNTDLTAIKVDVMVDGNDNWMAPPVQSKAVDDITAILSQVDGENGSVYQQAAAELKDKIGDKAVEVEARLAPANLAQVKVLCDVQQAGFVKWMGLNVIATYGRPDSLTPQVVKGLVDQGRVANVTLVIENLQSGAEAGKAIAEELGCKRIILSNFPGGFDTTETWEKAIDHNVDLILGALSQ